MIRLGPRDPSSQYLRFGVAYDSRCVACWLNHGHTQLYHQASVADHARRSTPRPWQPSDQMPLEHRYAHLLLERAR